jgi:hypothetical protein
MLPPVALAKHYRSLAGSLQSPGNLTSPGSAYCWPAALPTIRRGGLAVPAVGQMKCETPRERSRDRSDRTDRGAHLVQHPLLSGAHLLGPEAHEAALLGGVGSRLGRGHQPPTERLSLLGRGLGRHQLVDTAQLLQHLLAAARRPDLTGGRIDVTSAHRGIQGTTTHASCTPAHRGTWVLPSKGPAGPGRTRLSRVARSLRPRTSTGSSRDPGRLPQ